MIEFRRDDVAVLALCASAADARGLGGAEIHSAALVAHAPIGVRVLTCHPHGPGWRVTTGRPASVLELGGGATNGAAGVAHALETAVLGLGIDVLHVQAPQLGSAAIARAIASTGVRALVVLHDHALACENHDLLERGQRFCELPDDAARCDECLGFTRGRAPGHVARWRAEAAILLSTVDAVVAPSESVVRWVSRVHPELSSRARLIEWGVQAPVCRLEPDTGAGPLRVAIVGVHAPSKGSERLPALLEACGHLAVEWHVFGASLGRVLGRLRRAAPRVVIHGAYQRVALAERLARARVQVALLPSVAAESFSLTLSEIVAAGLPVVGSRLGALGERIEREALGWTFDPWQPRELADRLATLSCDRALLAARARALRQRPVRSEASMVADFAVVWRDLARLGRRTGADPGAVAEARATIATARSRALLHRGARLERVVGAIRHTDWYRNLGLRRMLPESLRARIERAALGGSWRGSG